MTKTVAPIYIFSTHDAAQQAIQSLGQSGFDVTKVSLLGKDGHSQEHPAAAHSVSERISSCGAEALSGGVWNLMMAPTIFLFVFPGLGLLAAAGPLVSALVGAFEGALLEDDVAALGTALAGFGVTEEQASQYEIALKTGKFLLILHGTIDELQHADAVLAPMVATA